jgi:hypothetical protein
VGSRDVVRRGATAAVAVIVFVAVVVVVVVVLVGTATVRSATVPAVAGRIVRRGAG